MKTLSLIAVASTIAAFGSTACAAEPFLSPKVTEFRYELRKVPSMSGEADLARNRPAGNAAAWSLAQDFRKVSSTKGDVNLAHAQRPTLSPKDPRYEIVLRENAIKRLKLAKTTAAE